MLTRNRGNCQISSVFEPYISDRSEWSMKNSKITSARKSSLESYSYFSWILSYNAIDTSELNDSISIWDFTNEEVYFWGEYPKNFSSKECVLPKDIKVKEKHFIIFREIWMISFNFNIFGKNTFFWAEVFGIFSSEIDLFIGEISNRNTIIQFTGIDGVIG